MIEETTEAAGGLAAFGLNLKIFIAQLVNFLIVLLVVWQWIYKPVVKLLDQRSQKIEQSMKHTQEIESRLAKTDAECRAMIKDARREATRVVEDAATKAETRRGELLVAAKQEVAKVVAQGKEQLNLEKTAMVDAARAEIVDLAMAATKKILIEKTNEKKSKQLAEKVINRL